MRCNNSRIKGIYLKGGLRMNQKVNSRDNLRTGFIGKIKSLWHTVHGIKRKTVLSRLLVRQTFRCCIQKRGFYCLIA